MRQSTPQLIQIPVHIYLMFSSGSPVLSPMPIRQPLSRLHHQLQCCLRDRQPRPKLLWLNQRQAEQLLLRVTVVERTLGTSSPSMTLEYEKLSPAVVTLKAPGE